MMSQTSTLPVIRADRFRFLYSQSMVLGVALFLGVIIPEILHPWASVQLGQPRMQGFGVPEMTILGAVLAIIIGHISMMRFTALPTIDAKTYIIPAFLF